MKNAPSGAFFVLQDRWLTAPSDMKRHQGSMTDIPVMPA